MSDARPVVDIVQAPNGCLAWVDIGAGSVHETCTGPSDADGDGFSIEAGDCNDADSTVFPDAPELCDSKDNDCNDTVDDVVCSAFAGATGP